MKIDSYKIIILLLVLFVGVVIGYNYNNKIAEVRTSENTENKKIKCMELGNQFFEKFEKYRPSPIAEYVNLYSIELVNPEFHYNFSRSTCLAYTGIIFEEKGTEKDAQTFYEYRITDVYTNVVIAYSGFSVFHNNSPRAGNTIENQKIVGNVKNSSFNDFNKIKADLFGQ